MKIKITFQGPVPFDDVENGDVISMDEGATLADLLNRCNVKKEFRMFIVPLVNGEARDPAYRLRDRDEVNLFMPVSGG
jgi:molybdopterin converting factor small subunit